MKSPGLVYKVHYILSQFIPYIDQLRVKDQSLSNDTAATYSRLFSSETTANQPSQ